MNSFRLKIELHSHTDFDPLDQIDYSAYQLIDEVARQGFEALAITCHDALQWSQSLADYAASAGVLLIPGVEATIEGKHVLIYGLEHFREPISFAQLRALRQSHPQVFTIAPHPFYPGDSCLGRKFLQYKDCFDAIEYCHFYTRQVNFNDKAMETAHILNKPVIGTSDVHLLRQVGKTYAYVTVKTKTFEAITAAIKAGQAELVSAPMSWLELTPLAFEMGKIGLRSRLMRLGLLSRKPNPPISSAEE
jgi:predicted metal-dependent phosphoesterase TrpH